MHSRLVPLGALAALVAVAVDLVGVANSRGHCQFERREGTDNAIVTHRSQSQSVPQVNEALQKPVDALVGR